MQQKKNKFIIITTINRETEAIKKFFKFKDWRILIIGDKKSKMIRSRENLSFVSINDQRKLNFSFLKYCPYNHYSRKNIGYLLAIKMGADVIYDTDDDNIPYKNWHCPSFFSNNILNTKDEVTNIYSYFTDKKVWPRGFPLEKINEKNDYKVRTNSPQKKVGVWQSLADDDPDVDAIYRLTVDKKIKFNNKKPIISNKFCFAPINSQSTFWHKDTFPYLYLPSTVSFRFTDILRGYIAQRLIWENNQHLGYLKSNVLQKRNYHNLMQDFDDEITCYLNVSKIIKLLKDIRFKTKTSNNLLIIYKLLLKNNLVNKKEVQACKAWISDIKKLEL